MLAVFYPRFTFVFQLLICLDISSHWIHVVLSIMCAGNELFFCMLYLVHFTVFVKVSVAGSTFGLWVALAWLTLPICILKQSISVIQLTVACINTASLDESERERVNK
ncbi:CDP-diacylglycerol--inositol 3-phosphatidyltransferase-like [Pocillopora damicornis]|uniref:CDP-diacylglycerol--inositol 3-phosphatidyltransferase-like n=1 Tax=Pocillopora damicornis TaxID=46731 RepID=UPI000F552C56|nr:CDP-diacylglycerol--inositol 3-phosphatidyltransferase-like [Pocillopora damicornis]